MELDECYRVLGLPTGAGPSRVRGQYELLRTASSPDGSDRSTGLAAGAESSRRLLGEA